jgi:hypothetical protein
LPDVARRLFGFAGAHRILWALFIVSLVLPIGLFGAAAWHSRTHVLDEAYKTVEKATLVLQGHAQKVSEAYELVVDQVEDRVHLDPVERVEQLSRAPPIPEGHHRPAEADRLNLGG